MKFSKHFPSSSTMSGFASSGSQQSAPSSALDIVPGWDALLSPNTATSSLATQEDIADPSFLLSSQQFSSELDNPTTGPSSDAFSWDSTSFSSAHLRPTTASMSDLHTPSPSSQTAPTAAFASSFPLMSLESTNYGAYPYSKSFTNF